MRTLALNQAIRGVLSGGPTRLLSVGLLLASSLHPAEALDGSSTPDGPPLLDELPLNRAPGLDELPGLNWVPTPDRSAALDETPALGSELATEDPPTWGQDRGLSIYFQLLNNQLGRTEPPTDEITTFSITEGGKGLDLGVGYSFNPSFHLQMSAASAVHTTSQPEVDVFHTTLALEAHWRFLQEQRGRPYMFVGLGGSSLDVDRDGPTVKATGGVSLIGLGFLYNLTRRLVFDAALRADFINWNSVSVREQAPDGRWVQLDDPVEESGSAAKLRFGLRWEF